MPNEAEGSCRRYRKARAVRAEFAFVIFVYLQKMINVIGRYNPNVTHGSLGKKKKEKKYEKMQYYSGKTG